MKPMKIIPASLITIVLIFTSCVTSPQKPFTESDSTAIYVRTFDGEMKELDAEIAKAKKIWKAVEHCWIDVKFMEIDEEKTGLNVDSLLEFARLKFKNSFPNIKSVSVLAWAFSYGSADNIIPSLRLTIGVVGIEFPIAYNVEIHFADDRRLPLYEFQHLGITDEKKLEEDIKESITSLIEKSAIKFYKVRGEL